MRKLIINADEFGLTKGTNKAIIETFQFGTVTSTTMIVNMWAFDDAVRLAKENPGLGIGIHLNLTDGRPLLPPETVFTLVSKDGFFTNRRSLWKKVTFSNISLSHIEMELRSQLEKIKSAGINITHIDTHQAVDLHPKIFSIVLKLAAGLTIPLRITHQGLIFRVLDKKKLLLRCISKIVCNRYIRLARLANIPCTDYFLKLIDFTPSPNGDLMEKWRFVLSNLQDAVFELMVHPAYLDDNLIRFMHNSLLIATKRQEELSLLLDQGIQNILRDCKIQLINFNELGVT
jgi:predicted glycoside hydrolase/deacetylase ChbG (UPF0249 family)